MANEAPMNASPSRPQRHWPLFLLGVLLFLAGPAVYVLDFSLHHLRTPWYMPIMASIGVVLMVVSVLRRRGVFRIVGLVVCALLCAGEWQMLLVGAKTPAYAGPAQPGQKLPTFVASLADGKAFSTKDLENGSPTVLVFFRGRW